MKIPKIKEDESLAAWRDRLAKEFNLDTSTGEITNLGQDVKRIDVKPGCFYRQALNRKNFVRKLIKEGVIKVVPKPKDD